MAFGLPVTLAACASAPAPHDEAPYDQAAIEAAAGVAALESMLASHDSATKALQAICDAKHKTRPRQVYAERLRHSPAPEPGDLRQSLHAGLGEPIGYRHVALKCGREVLSVAHNWYVPARLTPEMNAALDNGDAPFGRVAAPLGYRREEREPLYEPMPECPGNAVSIHRALLRLPDGQPLAYVVECYLPASAHWSLG